MKKSKLSALSQRKTKTFLKTFHSAAIKRIVCIALCAAVFSWQAALAETAETSETGENRVHAELLMEANTGQILYEKNANARVPIASITKATALLIWAEMIEEGTLSLDEKVKASAAAESTGGSVIWLVAGEEMTVAELLEAIIISSANDACIALAEHTAGSEAAFVKLMNKRAKALGAENTRYTGCVGFDDSGHYSTAHDIALVTAELMKHEVLRGWFLTWLDYLRSGETQLVNTNKLIRYYDGIVGGKTGTTDGAGCCLTVCAQRGEMRLIAVELGCEDDDERFSAAEELLDYGFDGFELFTPQYNREKLIPVKVTRGTADAAQPVIKNSSGRCVIKKGRSADVKYEYTFAEELEAPVEKGQFLGEYLVTLDGIEVYRSDIVAKDDVPRMNFLRSLWLVLGEIIKM